MINIIKFIIGMNFAAFAVLQANIEEYEALQILNL
ncbi:hypothetical protein NTGM5_20040 [Candidatus Nitrotoga sp. M5]|nr:hypothetical protein NTGM5_20040 [Candidatus Nitrotoga sp. M5]